jgi:hypothetical protein
VSVTPTCTASSACVNQYTLSSSNATPTLTTQTLSVSAQPAPATGATSPAR